MTKQTETNRSNTEQDFEFDLEPVKSITFYAAGVQFRPDWKDRLARLGPGAELYLTPEPTNKYDKNAVMISTLHAVSGEAETSSVMFRQKEVK